MTEKYICPGFKAAGVPAAIKYEGRKDLGLLFSERPATVAGVFTNNRVKAAPVLLESQPDRASVIAKVGTQNHLAARLISRPPLKQAPHIRRDPPGEQWRKGNGGRAMPGGQWPRQEGRCGV